MKKSLLVLSVVALLAAGCSSSQQANVTPTPTPSPATNPTPTPTPTPPADETANWKVFTSTKYGFEIKYPSDWSAPILNDSAKPVNLSFKPKGSSYFDIQMLSDSSFISQGSLEKNTSVFTQKNKGPWDQQIDINNGKAFYYINTSSKAGPSPSAYLVGPTGVWLITLTDINLKDTFLQMVSSFSFLSSTSSSQDWKTYANSGLGFQLTLTDAWKGYKVEMQTMSSNFGSGTLLFKVPTKDKKYEDGSGWATLMKISVYNPDYWKILQQGDGPKPQLLGKDKYGFAFAADFWQDPPTDLQNVNFDFNKVTASFKLTK